MEQSTASEFSIPDLADMIFFHADADPERKAIITGQAIVSFGKLRRAVLSLQHNLLRHGLKAGDRVAIHVDHAVAHIALIVALYRAGIASASIEGGQAEFVTDLVVDAVLTNVPGFKAFGRLIAVDDLWFEAKDVDPTIPNAALDLPGDALCRLILSSGTTGWPKIIGLSYEAVRERLVSYAIRTSTPSWDRLVCMLGLSTNFGYSFAITALWLGRTSCFSFDGSPRDLLYLSGSVAGRVDASDRDHGAVSGSEFSAPHLAPLDPHRRLGCLCAAGRAHPDDGVRHAPLRLRFDGRRHRRLRSVGSDLRHGSRRRRSPRRGSKYKFSTSRSKSCRTARKARCASALLAKAIATRRCRTMPMRSSATNGSIPEIAAFSIATACC